MEKKGRGYISLEYSSLDYVDLYLDANSSNEDWEEAIRMAVSRFEERFFTPIKKLLDDNPELNGFSIMALNCLLIDTFVQFNKGLAKSTDNSSKYTKFLCNEFPEVFSNQYIARRFYKDIRCGILHSAQTNGLSRLSCKEDEPSIKMINGGIGIQVNVISFSRLLQGWWTDNYVNRLKNCNRELREKFTKKMDYLCNRRLYAWMDWVYEKLMILPKRQTNNPDPIRVDTIACLNKSYSYDLAAKNYSDYFILESVKDYYSLGIMNSTDEKNEYCKFLEHIIYAALNMGYSSMGMLISENEMDDNDVQNSFEILIDTYLNVIYENPFSELKLQIFTSTQAVQDRVKEIVEKCLRGFDMTLDDDFQIYKEEIELSCAQNCGVETDLYSLIAGILRRFCKGVSIRDVSARRRVSDESKNIFYGEGGFPDFVVLERDTCSQEILGCIEAKNTYEEYDDHKDQIYKHATSYNKVLYTNGLEWKYLVNTKEQWTLSLGHRDDEKIIWEENDKWHDLIRHIRKIDWNENARR